MGYREAAPSHPLRRLFWTQQFVARCATTVAPHGSASPTDEALDEVSDCELAQRAILRESRSRFLTVAEVPPPAPLGTISHVNAIKARIASFN